MKIFFSGLNAAFGIYILGNFSFWLGTLILTCVSIWQFYWFFEGGWIQEALNAEETSYEQAVANFSFNISIDGENVSGSATVNEDGSYEFTNHANPLDNPPEEILSLIGSTLEVACDVLNDDFNVEFEHKIENGAGVISVSNYGDFEIGYCPRHNKFRYAYFETEVFSERNEPEYLKSLLSHFLSVK